MISEAQQMMKDSAKLVLLAGSMGAMAPNLAELVSITQMPHNQFEWPHLNFFIGMFIYGLMGMCVVLFGKEKTAWKAFLAGMGSPALFSSAGTVAVSVACAINPIGVAYAQETNPVVQDYVQVTVLTETSINMIVGNQIFRANDTLQIKIPKQKRISFEHMEQKAVYDIPQDKDSVFLKVSIEKQKGFNHLMRGLFPMMQQKVANKAAPEEGMIVKEFNPAGEK